MAITTQNTGAALMGGTLENGPMKKVKIISGTIVDREHVDPGTVVIVDDRTARTLIHSGKAVPHADEPKKPMTKEPEEVKPATKKKAKK